ncbi:MAG: restriction endonuclease subunit S [Clostridiaceae bacterium]|jgi:hypothetical protein|nr:restriction endonuclease subunit S [Clostridiaceae bacterium]
MGLLSYMKENGNEQPIDISGWKEFALGDLFEIKSVKGKSLNNYEQGAQFEYVSTSASNNGVIGCVDCNNNKDISKGNCISIEPVTGVALWHDKDFIGRGGAGSAINLLYNEHLNKNNALFLCSIISVKTNGRFSFSCQFNGDKLKKEKIFLPVDKDGKPDWEYMENYINNIYIYISNGIVNKVLPWTKTDTNLDLHKWKQFELQELFNFHKGKRLTKADMEVGDTNYLGAISGNNGIRQKINAPAIFQPNCLTVNYNGSVGKTFYQTEPFWASDDVNVLYPKGWAITKLNALFLAPLIQNQGYQFSYGSKWTMEQMKATIIYLPIDSDNKPDWEYMENYIKDIYAQSLSLIS